MARRILPHAPGVTLNLAVLADGEVATEDGTGRLRTGDGITKGGRPYAFVSEMNLKADQSDLLASVRRINLIEGSITSGRRGYATWAEAFADTAPAVNTLAEVPISDTGTHLENGVEVPNSGVYRRVSGAVVWQRIYDTDGAQIQAAADRAEAAEDRADASAIRADAAAVQAIETNAYARGVLSGFGTIATTKTKAFGPGSGGSTTSGVWRRLDVVDQAGNVTALQNRTGGAGTFKAAIVRPTGVGTARLPVAMVTLTSAGTAVADYPVSSGALTVRAGDEIWGGPGTAQWYISNDSGGIGVTFTGDMMVGQEFTPSSLTDGSRLRGLATLTYTVTSYEQVRYAVSVVGLARADLWADGTVANAQDPGGIFRQPPLVVPPDGTVNDFVRYRDAVTLVPPANETALVFANNSTSWGTKAQKTVGVGVRLPTGAYTGGNKVEAFCLNFLNGQSDTSQSSIAWNTGTLAADKRSIAFGAAQTLVVDSIASINKLVNPCAGHRAYDGGVLLFSRDARGDVPNLKLYELGFNAAGSFTKGIGGVPFAIGGTDAGAREVQGIIDPTWTRAYMCPQAIITRPDQTFVAPGWAVVGLSYRIWLLKRSTTDSEWTRFWTIAEGQAGIPNSNRVQGEQSVTPLKNGNLLVVDRRTFIDNIGARAWWQVDMDGNIVDAGLYVGLFDAAIGAGTCRLDDGHILAVGPRTSLGSGQQDVGMHAAVSYDQGKSFADSGPDFRNMSKPGRTPRYLYRKSASGDPITPTWEQARSGNSALVPIGDGMAVALIEGRGPTDAGTVGNYTEISAIMLNAASAIRNAEEWENL